jgi:hypothetical protein
MLSARTLLRAAPSPSSLQETPVKTHSASLTSEAVGIVIQSGAPEPKPVRFWAYLWAADEENASHQHWHERVPTEHAA